MKRQRRSRRQNNNNFNVGNREFWKRFWNNLDDVCSTPIHENRRPRSVSLRKVVVICGLLMLGILGSYQLGRASTPIQPNPIQSDVDPQRPLMEDLDALIDGSKGKPILVPDWGKTYGPLRVWCFVVAHYDEELLLIIQDTWGQHCDKIIYAVDEASDQDILRNEARNSKLDEIMPIKTKRADNPNDPQYRGELWEKIWKFYVQLEDQYHGQYDWVVRVDIDTWHSINNFKSFAQYFNPNLAWNMGEVMHWYKVTTANQGGGYAHSRRTVEKLAELFQSEAFEEGSIKRLNLKKSTSSSRFPCRKQQIGHSEDWYIGECLNYLGIFPLDTTNAEGKHRWIKHPHTHPDYAGKTDPCLISAHRYKDEKTRKSIFETLDQMYGEVADCPIPDAPHTFRFNPKYKLQNKDLIYKSY